MKFEGIGFNKSWIQGFATQSDFLKEMNSEGQKHIFKDDPKRDAKLKELYALATGKKEPAKEEK